MCRMSQSDGCRSLNYDVDGRRGYLLQVRKAVTLENITTYLALHIHSNKVDNHCDNAEQLLFFDL